MAPLHRHTYTARPVSASSLSPSHTGLPSNPVWHDDHHPPPTLGDSIIKQSATAEERKAAAGAVHDARTAALSPQQCARGRPKSVQQHDKQPPPAAPRLSLQTLRPCATPTIPHPALLSQVGRELRQRVLVGVRLKNGIEYANAFDGKEAIDKLVVILGTDSRLVAGRVGRALGRLRLFHSVTYEHLLLDESSEIYQFDDNLLGPTMQDSQSPRSNDDGLSEPISPPFSDPHSDMSPNTLFNPAASSGGIIPAGFGVSGIFTELTHCYSPTCMTSRQPCYNFSCPKRTAQQHFAQRSREASTLSITSTISLFQRPAQLWRDTAPAEVRDTISVSEWRRQEAISELVSTEENFVWVLNYLIQMWIDPIRTSEEIIPDPHKRSTLVNSVFANIPELYDVHSKLLSALEARQKDHPIVQRIGDVMLQHVYELEPFIQYGASRHISKFAFEHEKMTNPAFACFVARMERHPMSRRLPLNGFLSQPTTRAGRYTLLLEEILKHTPANHSDREAIPKIIEVIRDTLNKMNWTTGSAKAKFDLRRIHAHHRFKNAADEIDLNLLDPKRSIIKMDRLQKTSRRDSTEYQIILFDHYLVVAKTKLENAVLHYIIQRPPIPIEWVKVTLGDTTKKLSSPPGSGISDSALSLADQYTGQAGTRPLMYPITFHRLGRRNSRSILLYSASDPARRPWIDLIARLQQTKGVFNMIPIIQERATPPLPKVTHIVSFNNGQQYLLGTLNGVYVGHTHGGRMPRQVLAIDRVTQVEVVEESQKLFVLADRVLLEYPLHVVNGHDSLGRQIHTSVPFFYIGRCLNRLMVCVPSKRRFESYSITMYEQQRLDEYLRRRNPQAKAPHPLDLKLRVYKELAIPGEVWDIELTNSLLLVITNRGAIRLDLRDLNNLIPQYLLYQEDPFLSFVRMRDNDLTRTKPKRIALFRTPEARHIVCYEEFAFYIDGLGRRQEPTFLIEWEGQPEAFAFMHPYLIAFEPSFIEIRRVDTGERVQVIRGVDIKALSHHSLYRSKWPIIFGGMMDPVQDQEQLLFRLELN